MSLRAHLALLLMPVVFIENVLFYGTYVKNIFMIIWKNDLSNIFNNISYNYKTIFNK